MATPLHRLKVKLAVSVGWAMKGKLAEAIRGFQATEADGVWHLHRGLARLKDPRHRAILFTHSLEEESHAEEFSKAYVHYADHVLQPPNYERQDLYPAHEAPWKVFAYVHVGEEDATERFRLIQQELPQGVLKQSLMKVVDDEEGHVDLTHQMLVQMGATDREIRREVMRVRMARLWENWLRVGKRVVDNVASLLLSAVYFLAGPLLAGIARKKLANRFVEYDNNHLHKL